MIRRKLLVFLCFSAAGALLNGEKLFERLTVRDGLSEDIVHAISDDKRGFIWIGTDEGLNRYDGYEPVMIHRVWVGDAFFSDESSPSRFIIPNVDSVEFDIVIFEHLIRGS